MTLLAIAGMALVPTRVEAQAPVSYTAGDVFLGFRASGGTGASKDYLVNLGQASQFTGAAGPITVDVGGGISADLSATFGAGWATRADLFWSVSGSPSNVVTVGSDVAKTLYATKAQASVGTLNTTGWLRQGSTTQGSASSKMLGMAQAYALTAGVPNNSTANSTKAIIQNKTDANSFASYQPGGTTTNSGPTPGISYAYFNPTVEGSPSGSVLEFYRLVPGTSGSPGELIGLFALSDGGALTFVPANGSTTAGTGDATVQIQLGSYSVNEAGGSVTVKAVRGGNLSNSFTVDYQTTSGTAVDGTDFTGTSTTPVSFVAGQTESTFTIPIIDRSGPQGNRSFTVNLSNASSGASIATGSATVNVTEGAGDISFSASSSIVAPTSGGSLGTPATLHITLTRANAAGGSVSVDVSKTGGTILPAELTFTSPTVVTFANGQTSKSFDVVLNAIPVTLTRTIVFGLANATSGAAIVSPSTTTVNITKKDTLLPSIVITTPASTVATPGTFNLAGTVKEENGPGLTSFTVTFNGTPVTLASGPTLGATVPTLGVPFTATGLQADNGENLLVVTAVDASGNSTTLTKTVTYVNTTLGTALIGSYNGVIVPTGTTDNDKSGFVTLTVTATATFSGKVTLGGVTVPVSGVLSNAGVAKFKPTNGTSFDLIDRTEFDSYLGALTCSVSPGTATGTLSTAATGGTQLASFSARQNFYDGKTPATTVQVASGLLNLTTKGVYNLALPTKEQSPVLDHDLYPQGDGVTTVTLLTNGSVAVKGYLADGAPYAATGRLAADLTVALHTNLYRKSGSIAGYLKFDLVPATSDVTGIAADGITAGDMLWIRPALARSQYYPAGFTIHVDALGTKYTGPASVNFGQGGDVLPTGGNASLVFEDGLLTSTTTKAVNVNSTTGLVTLIPTTSTDYKLTLSATTGVFSGFFTHTDTKKPTYSGVILNKGTNQGGFGYFLSIPVSTYGASGESGGLSLQQ